MKYISLLLLMLTSALFFAQTKKDITIQNEQEDDSYLAGDTITVNAIVNGDLIAAGRQIVINESIYGDLTVAGASVEINNNVKDDVRMAAGKVVVDAEIGDDLVVFGGQVIITENAVINGNLICYGSDIAVKGNVAGKLDVRAENIAISGEVYGNSKLVSETINIESEAKFYNDVEYFISEGEVNFETSLVDASANFNESLGEENSSFSILSFGMSSVVAWILYIISVFLIILVFHGLFRNAFSNAVEDIEINYLKSFGFGLIFLIGVPLVIAIVFMMGIGLPLGFYMTGVFIFSVLVGHFISALVIVYYVKHIKAMNWNFWSITFLALVVTIALRLLINIPYVGISLSAIILSITYGALVIKAIQARQESVQPFAS